MSYLDLKIPHTLPQEEAIARIKKLLANLQQEHAGTIKNITEEWTGPEGRFSFSAKGFSIAGKIYVGTDVVRVGSKLPLMLSFYKSKIGEMIEKKGEELLRSRQPATS